MKIFVTSDTHNDGVILRKLKDFISENILDLVIHCGDIGGKDKNTRSLIEFEQHQECQYKDFISQFPNIIHNLGNDDWFETEAETHINKYPDHYYCNYDIVSFELVHITPFNTNREANENKIWYELNKLNRNFPIDSDTIIVAHDPPYSCLDMTNRGLQVGSKSVRNFIEEKQPKLWLCGHIHEDFGVKSIGNTGVFNCACSPEKHLLRGWVIDTDTLNYDKIII
jgi:Icc-related predicted phosphoesterase